MDNGGGGCCIARYGGGGGGGGYDISTIDRIMMKFRPIAPKPANGTSSSSSPEMNENTSSSGRGKRRLNNHGVRRCNNATNNRKRKLLTGDKTASAGVITLPLLPETPEIKIKRDPIEESPKNLPGWLSFGREDGMMMMIDPKVEVIGSCVTVECVTDTWVDLDELGCTEVERRVNLERDRCPGFISDGYGRVTWMNEAYKEMVREGEGEVVVWLVMKDKAAVTAALGSKDAFTCRVRVQNKKISSTSCGSNGKERSSGSMILPCDVWRMDQQGSSFAWRLDLTAALSLGR
ncbi:hypothetical protein M5689_024610 [Euphorbia peplus]|nr:hypothetical protein M5689_024610 [Euphorbia peplus]